MTVYVPQSNRLSDTEKQNSETGREVTARTSTSSGLSFQYLFAYLGGTHVGRIHSIKVVDHVGKTSILVIESNGPVLFNRRQTLQKFLPSV